MSCKMKIDTFTAADASDVADVHLMPCKINYNGEAKVKQYFGAGLTAKYSECSNVMTASFRGRPLEGRRLSLPKGYIGVVLKESTSGSPVNVAAADDDDDERILAVTQKFKDFTYWNLDLTPSADDKLAQVMRWISIAKAIHQPPTAASNETTNSSQDSQQPSQ